MNIIENKTGWIEVICGSMFSGKTEELIRRVRRAEYAKQKIQVFKPLIDDRYHETHVVSHSRQMLAATAVSTSEEILKLLDAATQVVAVDEVQFFDEGIVAVADRIANQGKRVIVAGLDQDFRGKPFGPVPQLLAIAEYITKNMAICVVCGNPANRTQRLTSDQSTILVGADSCYEARCRNCHQPEV